MHKNALYALGLALTAGTTFAIARQTAPKANPDSQYRLGPDSMPQEGVPKGEIKGPFVLEKCKSYPEIGRAHV